MARGRKSGEGLMVGKEERARGRESGVGLRMGKRGRDNGGKRGMTRDEEKRDG